MLTALVDLGAVGVVAYTAAGLDAQLTAAARALCLGQVTWNLDTGVVRVRDPAALVRGSRYVLRFEGVTAVAVLGILGGLRWGGPPAAVDSAGA